MSNSHFPYERPIADLSRRVFDLEKLASEDPTYLDECERLRKEIERLTNELYADLSPWQSVMVSRHPQRPHFSDYRERIFSEFLELHGDRYFRDDPSIVGGFATFNPTGQSVMLIGHQKGRGTKESLYRNFGMSNPEGYRKAIRLMDLADRYHRPVITFVDTSGAFPGIGAEERGQAEAIAQSMLRMSQLRVPAITIVIGEGGSGGALAIAVANRVFALEHVWYSVISPEACASILWKDGALAERAASTLKPTSKMALELGVIDAVVPEPPGGAHTDTQAAANAVSDTLERALKELNALSPERLVEDRYQRFMKLGVVIERS